MISNEQAVASAYDLYLIIKGIIEKDIEATARVSRVTLIDIINYWSADMNKLLAGHPDGVRPAKYIGYLAFWVRKLKPISGAYKISAVKSAIEKNQKVDLLLEISDINERVAIMLATSQIMNYALSGTIFTPDGGAFTGAAPLYASSGNVEAVIKGFFNAPLGHEKETHYENIVYNMRYRTFGPHHLVHIIDHIVLSIVNYKHIDECQRCSPPISF